MNNKKWIESSKKRKKRAERKEMKKKEIIKENGKGKVMKYKKGKFIQILQNSKPSTASTDEIIIVIQNYFHIFPINCAVHPVTKDG